MKTTNIKLLMFISLFAISCLDHLANERFDNSETSHNHKNISITITEGTYELKDGVIHSNIQVPNPIIKLKSNSNEVVKLKFELQNMRADSLPKLKPKQGIIKRGETKKSVFYEIDVSPFQNIEIEFENFSIKNSYKFGAVGDIQSAWDEGYKIAKAIKEHQLDFFICLGDFVMMPTDEEYSEALKLFNEFSVPVYHVLGNHDGDGDASDFELFKTNIGKANYKFVYNDDLFLFLDGAQQSISRKVFDYAQLNLEKSKEENKFIFIHVPIFDQSGIRGNSFNTSYDAARFMNLLIQNDVDIVFSGHIHSYQDFMISGVRNIIAGMGGGVPEALDGVGYGYLIIEKNEEGVFVSRIDLENK